MHCARTSKSRRPGERIRHRIGNVFVLAVFPQSGSRWTLPQLSAPAICTVLAPVRLDRRAFLQHRARRDNRFKVYCSAAANPHQTRNMQAFETSSTSPEWAQVYSTPQTPSVMSHGNGLRQAAGVSLSEKSSSERSCRPSESPSPLTHPIT